MCESELAGILFAKHVFLGRRTTSSLLPQSSFGRVIGMLASPLTLLRLNLRRRHYTLRNYAPVHLAPNLLRRSTPSAPNNMNESHTFLVRMAHILHPDLSPLLFLRLRQSRPCKQLFQCPRETPRRQLLFRQNEQGRKASLRIQVRDRPNVSGIVQGHLLCSCARRRKHKPGVDHLLGVFQPSSGTEVYTMPFTIVILGDPILQYCSSVYVEHTVDQQLPIRTPHKGNRYYRRICRTKEVLVPLAPA